MKKTFSLDGRSIDASDENMLATFEHVYKKGGSLN